MDTQEIIERLRAFDYPAKEYAGLVHVEMEPKNEANKITREEIHAALKYEVNKNEIRQIDPWTIVITF
jgi:hypothetical protein